ncbi:hypothetical protein, partial [Escherichia coli]|uniref:hypothetical protein n=1 Tax=Escherichia coli TaxID=562 RepID=UPI003EE4041C
EKVNEKSALIKLVRNEILAAGAYAYDADNMEYIDLETNERLERFDALQEVKVSQEAKALNHIEINTPKPSPAAPAPSPAA